MLDVDALDPASRALAHEFLRSHPHLRHHARAEPRAGSDEAFLVMTIPGPKAGDPALIIDTGEADRIVVQWGRWSQEFTVPRDDERSAELGEAISLVEDILAGDAQVYELYREDRWRGCGVLHDQFDDRRLLRTLASGTRIEISTWPDKRRSILVK